MCEKETYRAVFGCVGGWRAGQQVACASDRLMQTFLGVRSMKLVFKWLLNAAALICVAYLYDGVVISSFTAALAAAFVIGLFNMLLRPVLVLLTLPVTLITLGLFLFVINALMFWAAASLLDGFHVRGFSAALMGSLIYAVLGLLIDSAFQRLIPK
jgi:putative membrane protein